MSEANRKGCLCLLWLGLTLWCTPGGAAPIPMLPEPATMNEGAGSAKWLMLNLRLETGEELPFMVDTGAPITLLDKSLEERLGDKFETIGIWLAATGMRRGDIYAAPKLYLGDTPLVMDTYIATFDLNPVSSRAHERIMGVLGLDCLRHYCLQLDFEAREIRFMPPGNLNRAELGKAHPLMLSSRGQRFPPMFSSAGQNEALPYIDHAGLFGSKSTHLLIDTGNNVDGLVEKGAIKGHYGTRFAHWLFPSRAMRLPRCVWDGQSYTKLKVGTARDRNQLGLRFLARHFVTLDFPEGTMYLKQTRSDPLTPNESR